METKKSLSVLKKGGIKRKLFDLILFTTVLLSLGFLILTLVRSNMLSNIVQDSSQKQQESITETTSLVMDEVVHQTLARANRTEARIANDMFKDVGQRITFLANYATNLFAHPENYEPQPYKGPNPTDVGVWTGKVIYAEGTDPEDEALVAKLGLISNMTDMMIELCPAFDAATLYISTPEGAHLSISDDSDDWFVNGRIRNYDPRTRGWYQKAVAEKQLIYSDGELDATTGVYCIECAMPVYGPDGNLEAVIGADLFLNEMKKVMAESTIEGEYNLLVNQNGHAVLAPQGTFPVPEEDYSGDLRNSTIPLLSQVINEALSGKTLDVSEGELMGGNYYITASPIKSTGWVLISAYDQRVSGQPAEILQNSLDGIQNDAREAYQSKFIHSRQIAILSLFLLMALALGAALWLGTGIVRPIRSMTDKVRSLDEENRIFRMEDEFRTGDEVEELAEAFSTITEKTSQYMDEIVKVTAEKERMGAELSLATQIQTAMLPHIFPAFPHRKDFDVYAVMDPAKEVGGDFYDYFLIDEDHLGMVIADVSGKGIPAALFMMASKIILQSVAMLGNSPAAILTKTNEAICSNNETEMFVTVWLGILELSTGKLIASNAGHEYPTIMKPNGEFEIYKDKHGFVIGGFEGSTYTEYELQLEPGAKLFVYTDGVPEATNADNELYGVERMVDALNTAKDKDPQGVLQTVRESVDDFVKEAEQFDDLTMLCLQYVGPRQEKN